MLVARIISRPFRAWKNYFAPRIRCTYFFSEGTVTNPTIWWVLSAVRIFLSLPTGTVTLPWVAESSVPLLPFSLWRTANARNVSFLTLYGGQFTLSTQLIVQNYPVILSHRRSPTVSLETYPFIQEKKWWSRGLVDVTPQSKDFATRVFSGKSYWLSCS